MKTKKNENKKKFINWCRNCHFDYLICIKEIKGKRWMAVLSHIEHDGDFKVDDYLKIEDSWKKILNTINKMENKKIDYLYHLKYNV